MNKINIRNKITEAAKCCGYTELSHIDLCKMNDIPSSIENKVELILPSSTPGYTITPTKHPTIVSFNQ